MSCLENIFEKFAYKKPRTRKYLYTTMDRPTIEFGPNKGIFWSRYTLVTLSNPANVPYFPLRSPSYDAFTVVKKIIMQGLLGRQIMKGREAFWAVP